MKPAREKKFKNVVGEKKTSSALITVAEEEKSKKKTVKRKHSHKTKTQIAIGKRVYVNEVTGEKEEFAVIQKNVASDNNFHKIWLHDLLSILETFGNQRIKVLSFLLKIMRAEDNSVSCTYRIVAAQTGISYATVAATMKELVEANVIKYVQTGLYRFNPDLLVKGDSRKRQRLLVEYNFDEGNDVIKTSDDYYDEVAKEGTGNILDYDPVTGEIKSDE